jgi:hypothetical protein
MSVNGPQDTAGDVVLLSLRLCKDIVKVIVKKQKTMRLDLVLERLATWIVDHCCAY